MESSKVISRLTLISLILTIRTAIKKESEERINKPGSKLDWFN